MITVAIFFAVVLYFGASRIYDRESQWRHEIASLELSFGQMTIQSFFENLKHHLHLMQSSDSVLKLINSSFKSTYYMSEVQNLFYNLVSSSGEIYQIRMFDADGMEIVRVYRTPDGNPNIADSKLLKNGKIQKFILETQDHIDRIHVSPIDINSDIDLPKERPEALIHISSQFFDSQNHLNGLIIMTISVSKLFELLPKSIFFQTQAGHLLALQPGGTLVIEPSGYDLYGLEGILEISNTETIHYATINEVSGQPLTVGIYHHHIGLKTSLQRLILISILLLLIFFGIILVVSYLSIQRLNERNRAQKALVSSLVELTDWRDPQTGEHLNRTKTIAMQLARELQKHKNYSNIIDDEFVENIYGTAPLHDIGKVGIHDSILLKAGRLDNDEIQEMQKHTLIGRQVLQDVIDQYGIQQPFIVMARNIAASHHERFDGTGYPVGLLGNVIPIEARIFALADVYDALRSKRPYKESISHIDVVEKLQSERGKHFDPDILDVFLKIEKKISALFQYDNSSCRI
jgi:putative two-component system response regulator